MRNAQSHKRQDERGAWFERRGTRWAAIVAVVVAAAVAIKLGFMAYDWLQSAMHLLQAASTRAAA